MNPPTVRENAGIFAFEWKDEGIGARVDHLRITKDNMHAELTITSARPAQTGHVHHSKVNLLSTTGRKQVANLCGERINDLDWPHIIEVICETVIRLSRSGTPALPIIDIKLDEAVEWRLFPVLHAGHPTVIFGYGGTLKSYIAAYYSVQVSLGIGGAEPGNVMVLDWESDEQDWRRRVAMVSAGLEISEPPNLYYLRCWQPLPDVIEEVQREGLENNISLYIVDSAAYACGGEPEKADPTMQFFRSLRSLHETTLVIAHQRDDDNSKRPFGSMFWVSSPRCTIQTIKAQEPDQSVVEVGLFNRKTNNGRLFKPFGYRAQFTVADEHHYTPGDAVNFQRQDIGEIPDLVPNLSQPERLRLALRNGRMSNAAIYEVLGTRPEQESGVRRDLARLRDRGVVEQLANEWGLAVGTFGQPNQTPDEHLVGRDA